MTLLIDDDKRVRTLTLNRPEALNAFNEALYDATAEALLAAASDPEVAVVLLTGTGRGFSAGTDLAEMQARITDPDFSPGRHGFTGLIDAQMSNDPHGTRWVRHLDRLTDLYLDDAARRRGKRAAS